jgi:hypothetical protein
MVHPEILKAHATAGFEYVLTSTDRVAEYYKAVTANQPKQLHIDGIYRHKEGGFGESSESLFWHQTVFSTDEDGNEANHYSVQGKYEKPIFQYQFDVISKKKKATGISRFETVYEVPFSKDKLDQFVAEKAIDAKTNYYVESMSTVYTVTNFEDFRNLSHDDLVWIARTGLRPGQTYEQVPRPITGAMK